MHLAAGLALRLSVASKHIRFVGRASNATPRFGRQQTLIGGIANRIDAIKYRAMDRIIAVSHELAEDLVTRLHLPAERITVIPNGIDLTSVRQLMAEPLEDSWFAASEPPVIISAGRLSKQKNYELLIEAFALLRQKIPMRLVILGDGSRKMRERLISKAVLLNVDRDVKLIGYEANPLRYFARGHLFVLTSLWEGASNVLLEALACGCPVVATDCPTGVRELLGYGRVGTITPPGDAAALAKAVDSLLRVPRNSVELQAHAAKFDLRDMLRMYLDVIHKEVAAFRR
jgi:glycosyltransferase involved in cell wall biosynthesis